MYQQVFTQQNTTQLRLKPIFKRIKLKEHYKDNGKANHLNKPKIKEKKHIETEKKNHHSIETYVDAAKKDVESAAKGKPNKNKPKSHLDKRREMLLKNYLNELTS